MDVFEAISNELRRKILKELETPRTFSELCERLKVDSPTLAFHLRKLAGLVTKDEEGRYALTEEGKRALAIIKTVEEKGIVVQPSDLQTPVVIQYLDRLELTKGM